MSRPPPERSMKPPQDAAAEVAEGGSDMKSEVCVGTSA